MVKSNTSFRWVTAVSLLTCSLHSFADDVPFVVSGFSTVGARSMEITTAKSRIFTASELLNAEADQTIGSLINNAVTNNTLIQLPAGTFHIPITLFISGKTNVILRGAVDQNGRPATILNFTRSLTDLYGNNIVKYGSFGAWHGGGGLITVGSKHPQYTNGSSSASSNIGIENIHIKFNRTVSNGGREAGYNGIYFSNASQSYIKNVQVTNFDSAILFAGSTYNTVKDIVLDAVRGGHFGVLIFRGSYNWVKNVVSVSGISHDISVQTTHHNVFSTSRFAKGAYDGVSFRGGSSNNLFYNIDVRDTALGTSNGQSKTDPVSFGPNEIFWNCMSQDRPLTTDRVPANLRSYIRTYYGSQTLPF